MDLELSVSQPQANETDETSEWRTIQEFENINAFQINFSLINHSFATTHTRNVDLSTSELAKIFKEKIIDKKLIEKWLDFYVYQLKRDIEDEAQSLINHAESIAVNDDQQIKPDMSIINPNSLKFKRSTADDTKKKLKSKSLLDSIKMLLLLINKTTRLINTSKPSENKKVIFFQEKLSIKKIDMDCVLTSLLNSLQHIINHFLSLNDALLSLQQEQKLYHPISKNNDFFLNSCKKISSNFLTNNSKDSNFITLRQSNEIVKEFHSISNLIMILITSVNDSDCFNDSEKLTKNLINLLEQLILEDFNYFPAIINSIQTCLLHLVNLNKVETVSSMEKNESLLKKLLHNCCKIFSKSITNLEDESILKSSLIKDTILTFVLNNDLIKFLIGNFDEKYWLNELVESCIIQCLYGLFEKYIHKQDMSDAMYSILDLFFSLAINHVELLAKSDFNTRTCLLASKLFEYSAFVQKQSPSKQLKLEKGTTKWSNVLKIYINIQTTLIEKLKYKYLKDSILFFGSYFETMVQIATTLHHSLDLDLLDIIRAFSRYLAQISLYTKELLLNIQNSTQHLESLFTSLIQLCIMKLSHVRIVSMKAHHSLQTTIGSHQSPLSKLAPDDLVNIQNLLFSIMSLNLSGLFNFAPNFADPNYLIKLDEYRPILAFQLAPPSSFDSHSTLSFGSILWLIDFILKILHKYDHSSPAGNASVLNSTVLKNTTIISSNLTPNKRVQNIINSGNPNSTLADTSPKKNASILEDTHIETKLPSKSLIICVLEKCLNILLSQIVLCEKVSHISPRDKKLLKRELNSEINSIIQGLGRTLKKQTTLSQHPTKSPTASAIGSNAAASSQVINNLISTGSKQIYEFFKCIQFVLQQNVN
ncbi:unnamed protein product [Brachionus calyciflorus]|uniref:Uncharacterized protein n=1 Tax=Brachionus calyciflorus TaxID=104777 RepID=A0A813P5Y7_9BILA|nr:unnamed protein product [Brachionus calyciflorus]